MKWYAKHRVIYSILILLIVLVAAVVVEFLMIKDGGTVVPAPTIPRSKATIGSGKHLKFAILGDSTSIGQGGVYDKGIAVSTAAHIASKGHTVTYQNFGISGARVQDVLTKQTTAAAAFRPDIILLCIGANDVTHLTSMSTVRTGMRAIVAKLRATNPAVKIIITGSPQMGSVPRFPQPVKYLAKRQTAKINKTFATLATAQHLTFAHIADKTGAYFLAHPEIFAADNFHPTTAGYAVWQPVLDQAVDSTL